MTSVFFVNTYLFRAFFLSAIALHEKRKKALALEFTSPTAL